MRHLDWDHWLFGIGLIDDTRFCYVGIQSQTQDFWSDDGLFSKWEPHSCRCMRHIQFVKLQGGEDLKSVKFPPPKLVCYISSIPIQDILQHFLYAREIIVRNLHHGHQPLLIKFLKACAKQDTHWSFCWITWPLKVHLKEAIVLPGIAQLFDIETVALVAKEMPSNTLKLLGYHLSTWASEQRCKAHL